MANNGRKKPDYLSREFVGAFGIADQQTLAAVILVCDDIVSTRSHFGFSRKNEMRRHIRRGKRYNVAAVALCISLQDRKYSYFRAKQVFFSTC